MPRLAFLRQGLRLCLKKRLCVICSGQTAHAPAPLPPEQYDLPDIGDQVLCLFLSYGLEQGFVLGAMYGRQAPPVSSGDKWHRTFSDGTWLEYDRGEHKLAASVQGSVDMNATGAIAAKSQDCIALEAPIIYARGTFVNTAQDGSPGKAVFSGGMEILDGGINVPDADVVASGVSLVSHLTEGVMPGTGLSKHPQGGSDESPGTSAISQEGLSETDKLLLQATRLSLLAQDVQQRGNAIDKLIMCLPEIAAAMAGKDLPARQAWLYLHEMFSKWLAGCGSNKAVNGNDPFWIEWRWALDFLRARAAYNEFTSPDLQEATIYSLASMKSLGNVLCKNGFLDPEKELVNFDFTKSNWREWDALYYTLYRIPFPIQMPDPLYYALGAFTFRALAAGSALNLGNSRWRLKLKKVAVFVHDTFNFEYDFPTDYLGLGYWSCTKKDGGLLLPAGDGYLPLANGRFRDFRNKFGMGGDFLVLSLPHEVENSKEAIYEFSCGKY